MALKNHYQTLHLPPTASPDEIKKAFRKLAHQYHPDKSNHDAAHKIFPEIQEAYNVLGDAKKKKLYDEERYFSGLSSRKGPTHISADRILKLAAELSRHTAYLYSADMNHLALYEYTMLILSDTHLAYLEQESDEKKNNEIIKEVLQAIKKLEYAFYEKITVRLSEIKPVAPNIHQLINKELYARKDKKIFEKWLPWLMLITVLFLCILMDVYSRH